MKKITFIAALLCSISAFSVNIVNNGTFEHATANYAWLITTTSPGVQTVAIEAASPITGTKSAKATVTTSGSNAAGLSMQVGIACAKGATYKISFKAKATNAADMTVKVTNSSATGTAVTTQTASLTSTVQSFEFTFANTNLCSYNFLVFQYGNFTSGTVITLDDVAVEEVTNPLTNGNLCNGDFEANVTLGKSAGSLTGYASFMDANISWTQLKLTGATMNMYTSATTPISGLKSFVCNVGATPGATNAAQMVGWSFAAVVGKKYTCSFKAKIATGTFNAGIKLISYNGGITNFDNLTGVALTTTPQTFTFTSNAITEYSPYYILCLQIGTAAANTNITIDDVELYIAELETPTAVSPSTISNTGFTASWNAIPRAESYDVNVYQGASLVSGSPFNASGQATTSLAIAGLSANTEYTYTVTAKGNTTSTLDSPASAPITFATTTTGLSKFDNVVKCNSVSNGIKINGLTTNDNVLIYSVSGSLIASKKAQNSTLSFNLSKGIYLVRVANSVNKVVVQ